VIRCRDEYYIGRRWRGDRRGNEGESAEFIPEKKKIVIYTREKLQKRDFLSACINFLYSYRILGNCFISLYSRRNAGGRVSDLPYNHNYAVLITNIFHSEEGVNSG
jgi:hypothetical protein